MMSGFKSPLPLALQAHAVPLVDNIEMDDQSEQQILRRIERLAADISECRRESGELKSDRAMIERVLGDLAEAAARREERFTALEDRLTRIERRLGMGEGSGAE
jgi:chromosome segregation ATPase